jgi:hypothetical protein|tara:strand:- start:1040 stop:1246 length:207 start_codon:yes stop_codon:yes gene_type:complete
MEEIKRRLEIIESHMTNHITDIKKDVSCIRQEVTKIGTDVIWLKKFFWLIMGVSVAAVIGSVFGLIFK